MKLLKNILLFGVAFALLFSAVGCNNGSQSENSEDVLSESEISDSASEAESSDAESSDAESSEEENSKIETYKPEDSDAESVEANSDAESSDTESVEASIEPESSDAESVEASIEPESSDTESVEASIEPESSDAESVEDDIIGSGTENDPYMIFPNTDNMTAETISVPAGDSVHYGIYRIGGMVLTINDADVYVVYDGKKYEAENGTLSLRLNNALASDAINLEVGNNGASEKKFLLSFANVSGSFMNPEVVESLGEDINISLDAGEEQGYYYKHFAEKDGTIRFYMTASTDGIILVQNNRNSAQRTSDADMLTDESGAEYIELDVEAGDEIIINVGAKPNKRGKYPATEITWRGEYK